MLLLWQLSSVVRVIPFTVVGKASRPGELGSQVQTISTCFLMITQFTNSMASLFKIIPTVGIENFYGADAAAYDASAIANPTLLQVFSAGNSGSHISTPTDHMQGFQVMPILRVVSNKPRISWWLARLTHFTMCLSLAQRASFRWKNKTRTCCLWQ